MSTMAAHMQRVHRLVIICVLCCLPVITKTLGPSNVVFVVLSQANTYHVQRAKEFKSHFEKQLENQDVTDTATLLFTHTDFPDKDGYWTILPLLKDLISKYGEKSWLFFCEDETRIVLKDLLKALDQYDPKEEHFLGKALKDKESTIIHHFAFFDDPSSFSYPDFAAGFLISIPLAKMIQKRFETQKVKSDFSIDGKHELAMYIWNDGKGKQMEELKGLCTYEGKPHCFTSYEVKIPDCGKEIDEDKLYVAVKTCKKFKDRAIIVKNTWGPTAKHLEFISEEEDPSIPTISLGVPNTERGHCGKTMKIIKRAVTDEKLKKIPWVLIADDDTLINLRRLRKLLACYEPTEAVALGEQYAYGVVSGFGYNYITGGGGMVFSQAALAKLAKVCKCGQIDSPDDMVLGTCLQSLQIKITHSPLFHQARPDDYSAEYLKRQVPISFHKHWNNDPYEVYKTWLTDDDQATSKDSKTEEKGAQEHIEL